MCLLQGRIELRYPATVDNSALQAFITGQIYKIWGRNKTLLGPFRCNLRTVCIVLVWISGWQPVIGHFQDGTFLGRDSFRTVSFRTGHSISTYIPYIQTFSSLSLCDFAQRRAYYGSVRQLVKCCRRRETAL